MISHFMNENDQLMKEINVLAAITDGMTNEEIGKAYRLAIHYLQTGQDAEDILEGLEHVFYIALFNLRGW